MVCTNKLAKGLRWAFIKTTYLRGGLRKPRGSVRRKGEALSRREIQEAKGMGKKPQVSLN